MDYFHLFKNFVILLARIVLPLFIGAALGDGLARAMGLAINSITSYIFFAIFFVIIWLIQNKVIVTLGWR